MKRSGFNVSARLIQLVKPLKGYMVLSILMGTIGHLCATFISVFAMYAILHALDMKAPLNMTILMICMISFAIIRAILRYGEQGCNHYIAFRLLAIIRDHVFKALRKLAPAKLEGKDKGDLISLITTDVELLEVFYAHTISPIGIAIIYTIFMVIFIGQYNLLLGMLALFSYLSIGVALPLVISMQSQDSSDGVRQYAGKLSTTVLDNLRGLDETIQYDDGIERLSKMNDDTEVLLQYQEKTNALASKNRAISTALIYIFDIAMILSAILLNGLGNISMGNAMVCIIAFMSSFGPTSALAALGSTLQNTFASGNRILDILDETPLLQDIEGKKEIEFDRASAKDVSFAYDKEKVLDHVNLIADKNQIIGLCGKSGSGKSTLLKLFMRFWEVSEGQIDISDTNINSINTKNLRNMESYMTQDTHLFQDTIKNNIKIAKLDASDEEVIEACKKASIHDFIMKLKDGYDTQVGELGDTLSGGERQRIALARIFLHDAPFVLLDEPTSNLDSLNEGIILKSLKEEGEGKTILLVSHRPSTMRICDKEYSVENGRVS